MPDWSESMQQTFEYYIVDPNTWADTTLINSITSSSITRDSDSGTKSSATIDLTDNLEECYVRIYLKTIQNGITEKTPLGTFLAQTPSINFNGKSKTISIDAYSPLVELQEKSPPIGYFISKKENVMDSVYSLTKENLRAPVVKANCNTKLYSDFVADPSETWLSFLTDLMSNAKYEYDVDAMGRILFGPVHEIAKMQPVYTYEDNDISILYPDISVSRDLYGIPNVVEVIYSKNNERYYARVVNDDPSSPISTVNRGREIVERVTNPNMIGDPTNEQIQEYAEKYLRNASCLEYTISYSHGYCPVRVGDCVLINYEKAGLNYVKAKVISQTINCDAGCKVSEKAVITDRLWG